MEKLRYQEISDDLEAKIRRRELTGRLPGIIRLTGDYNAGQSTVKRAVRQLTDKGLLTVDGTRGTFIAGSMPTEKRSGVIGLVGSFVREPENARLLEALNSYAVAKGYAVVQIADLQPLLKSRLQALAEMPFDGFLVFHLTTELAAAIRGLGKSMVALNACYGIPGVSWADFDWEPALREVFRKFAGEGRKIGFAMWNNNRYGFRKRMADFYRAEMSELGCFDPACFWADISMNEFYAGHGEDYMADAGEAAAQYFLRLPDPPAVIYDSLGGNSASSIRRAYERSGKKVEIVYPDFFPQCGFPYLKMDWFDLLRGGIDLLLRQIAGENCREEKYMSPVRLLLK